MPLLYEMQVLPAHFVVIEWLQMNLVLKNLYYWREPSQN